MTQPIKMRAVGFDRSLVVDENNSLFSYEENYPTALPTDVIVKVSAVSVNPADAKVRIRTAQDSTLPKPRIIGFDAVGEIVSVGESVTNFAQGDRVYYAGDASRPGTNAEFHAVDSRIIAKAPTSLNDAEAAARRLHL